MAVFGSLLFNRTLKQFLACKDVQAGDCQALADKIRDQAEDQLEKILETIPAADAEHAEVLKQICQDVMKTGSEDRILESLGSDTTVLRAGSKTVLSESLEISPVKLLKRLQDQQGSRTEIIDIIEFQKSNLPPELLFKNALRLEPGYAKRLLEMAQSEAERTDLSAVSIDIDSLDNPDIKIAIIRFLGAVNKPEAAEMIARFLKDTSKIIVIEALKNLKQMKADYDPTPIARAIPNLREQDVETAFEILEQKASPDTLAALTPLMTGKSEEMRNRACAIAIQHTSKESLEKLLLALDVHEWWGKDQAVKCLVAHGNEQVFEAASGLTKHPNEFVRNAAEQLSIGQTSAIENIDELKESLMHENWQVRERAIESAGKTENRGILKLLDQVVDKYPESSVAVLRAVSKLGFSKGLEIASRCLRMKEATIQREALLTTQQIVDQRHADNVRNALVKMVPKLQATVRDTAQDVINGITETYHLPKLKLDEDALFETRLLKIEENQDRHLQAAAAAGGEPATQVMPDPAPTTTGDEKTEVVSFQHIEELKEGDFWMDRYKVVKEIGRGAMGRVMLVHDDTVGEELVLKFMHPELTSDGKARERFLRELKYSRKISHPNVIRIHDFLTSGGISAISMEYFISRGLDYMIKHDLLASHEQILEILYQVCDGMYEAHQSHVIHRDLKPSNILVNDDNLAKVVDFGIASATTESEMTLTKTGMIIGTPAYLSPERAKGLEADHRSDIYALGIIAYAMFNGSPPYKGEPMSLLFQHIEGNATPLYKLDKGISAEVSMVVERMMHADIEKRFQTMKDVRDSIKKLM